MSKHFWPDKQTLLVEYEMRFTPSNVTCRGRYPLAVKILKHKTPDTQESVTLMQHFSLLDVIMLMLICHKDLI